MTSIRCAISTTPPSVIAAATANATRPDIMLRTAVAAIAHASIVGARRVATTGTPARRWRWWTRTAVGANRSASTASDDQRVAAGRDAAVPAEPVGQPDTRPGASSRA